MPLNFSRQQYAELFGPTVGDQVRLADTELWIQVERDLIAENGGYGNEVKFGGGKVIRDGMGQSPRARDAESLDLVLTNAVILDPLQGVIKADLGIKNGRIVGIGHAGNPGIQSGITMVIGAATEVIAAEGCLVTAGGIDGHIHFICPQQIDEALASGITTMIGGGTGARDRHQCHHMHARALEPASNVASRGGISDQSRFPRQRQLRHPGTVARTDSRGRDGSQTS